MHITAAAYSDAGIAKLHTIHPARLPGWLGKWRHDRRRICMTPADSQALPRDIERLVKDATGVNNRPEYESMGAAAHYIAETAVRELNRACKMNRLILRDSLKQKYGRNPTGEEMHTAEQDYSIRAESER